MGQVQGMTLTSEYLELAPCSSTQCITWAGSVKHIIKKYTYSAAAKQNSDSAAGMTKRAGQKCRAKLPS